MRILISLLALTACDFVTAVEPIHVLVWDERQPRQSEAYENFLGNEIVAQLSKTTDDIEFRSVCLDDPQQGLSVENVNWSDVIIWWGHVRQKEVTEDNVNRVVDHILSGDGDLIALHSAHWSSPFVAAMNWRSVDDVKAKFAETAKGKQLAIESIKPPRQYTVPIHGSAHTPAYFGHRKSRNEYQVVVHLPWCCFPDYRPDGEPGTLKVMMSDHPIAAGLPQTFQMTSTEMYNEPFHVPDPDEVIFEETWELGERFRSGMVWNIGKGKVFYFRPGHETYPVFKQPEALKVLDNAIHWLGR